MDLNGAVQAAEKKCKLFGDLTGLLINIAGGVDAFAVVQFFHALQATLILREAGEWRAVVWLHFSRFRSA